MPAEIIIADPPWQHDDTLGHRGAEAEYSAEGNASGRSTLTLEEICAFPLGDIVGRETTLALWRVHPLAREAFAVAEAWGFEPVVVGEIVWRKLTARGGRHFGLGYRIRHEHEVCQLFKTKRGAPKVADHAVRSCFDTVEELPPGFVERWTGVPVTEDVIRAMLAELEAGDAEGSILDARMPLGPPPLVSKRGVPISPTTKSGKPRALRPIHSAKPREFYELIERLFPWPTTSTHVELFAREERDGWDCYGNELPRRHPINNSQPVGNL